MTDKLINKIEELPLSGDDLLSIAHCLNVKRVQHMLYDDLVKFNTVEELFGYSIDAIYILLQIKNQETGLSSVGHWVCFINHRDRNEYYWFDPYGLQIAQELSLTHEPATIFIFGKLSLVFLIQAS